MGKNQNNQAAEDANAPQDTDETVDESLQSAPEPEEQPGSEAEAEVDELSTEGLVAVSKDGVTLHVHPETVNAHVAAGWTLV